MNEEFSVELLDKINKGPWPVAKWSFNGGPLSAVVSMKLLSEVTMVIGWHEHTNDWNPFFEFVMKDGTVVETVNTVLTIPGWNNDKVYGLDDTPTDIYVETYDPAQDEPVPKNLRIEDIETVEFCK